MDSLKTFIIQTQVSLFLLLALSIFMFIESKLLINNTYSLSNSAYYFFNLSSLLPKYLESSFNSEVLILNKFRYFA